MGIAGLLMSVFGLAGFPNLINWLIPIYGWQVTYMILGLILLVVMLPLAAIFLRDRPEQYGLQPDGDLTETDGDSPSLLSEEHWTLSEAIRTTAFWVMALGIATIAMQSTGLFFHMVSIFADNGLAPTAAATVYIPVAVTTAIAIFSSGILVDRLPVKTLLAVSLWGQAACLALAPYLYDVTLVWVYGIILGATFGLSRTVLNVVWAIYFGRRHLGSISGVASTIMVIGGSLGPLPFGFGRDLLGSYTLVLLGSAILPLVLGVVTLFVDKPRREM
jgi:sugar phosphate permease